MISLVELLTLGSVELADKIDGGETITSALVKKSITLLKMEISKVKGIGLKKVENDAQKIEYERQETVLYSRLNFLNDLYKELLDAETGSDDTASVWFIGSMYDTEME